MNHLRIRQTWEALSSGDTEALEAILAPEAKWRAVEDGPWNCENRAMILDVMRRNLADGLSGRIEEISDVGQRIVVGFRPDEHGPDAWPLEDGVRYIVLTTRDDLITEMKGCADRQAARAYAAAG